jgi:hypothetical protein
MTSFHSTVAAQTVLPRQPRPANCAPTDRDMLKKRLAQTEGDMAMSNGHIAGQRKFVAELVRDGHDASQALALLRRFEELQQLHIAHRDWLREALCT